MSSGSKCRETRQALNPFYEGVPIDRRAFLGMVGGTVGMSLAAMSGDVAAQTRPGSDRGGRGEGPGRRGGGEQFVLPAALAEYAELSVVLGRVTDKSIHASVLSRSPTEGYIELGTAAGRYATRTPVKSLPAGEPVEIRLDDLAPDTEYFYRLHHRPVGATAFTARPERRFATQRAAGKAFCFTIQGDSHPERMGKVSDTGLYATTLLDAAAKAPDFHVCLGDDFSVARVRAVSPEALAAPYLLQRPFLGLIGQTAPVFLMNGNHEQGSLYNYSQTDVRRDVAVGVQVARNKFYPTPSAGGFYAGDPTPWKDIGELKSYCAWTWGDALFVILDNYWHSPALVDTGFRGEDANPGQGGGERGGARGAGGKGRGKGVDRDWWAVTLGDAQYRWLERTLRQSKAKYKFVFAHHVHGSGRGGVELADLYEWGGTGRNGTSFATKRPGWDTPVHALMKKHNVSIFFQGHDHLYCRQEKDGIVYQEVPMPSDSTYEALNRDRYAAGTTLPNSGYLHVSVAPAGVKVDYVRTFLKKDESAEKRTGVVAHSYVLTH